MKRKSEQGILTVESSIVLTLMLMFVLFLFSFSRVYQAQNLVSHATLQAADAVALESYLRETALESDVDDIVYLASNITSSNAISAEGLESLRTADVVKIAKQKFIAAIASSEGDADAKLKSLGVKNGLSGVDFSSSRIVLGADDVIVHVNYTIEMQFPVFGAQELTVSKAAKAKTFGDILFALTTSSSNDTWGYTSGDTKVVHGTEVEITATPNYGYKFVKWDDGNTDPTRTVTVTDAVHYKAIFEKDSFGVNVNVKKQYADSDNTYKNNTFGTVSGAGTYLYLDTVTLVASPKPNYQFVGWDIDSNGSIDDRNATRTVTVDKTYHITAVFEPKTYTVTVKSGNTAYGTVNIRKGSTSSSTSINAQYGSTVTLTANVKNATLYEFTGWSNSSTSNPTNVVVTGTATYTANFKQRTCTVTFKNGSTEVKKVNVIIGSSVSGSKNHTGSTMPSGYSYWTTSSSNVFDSTSGFFTDTTTVNSNTTVYAVWKVTFQPNNGGGNVVKYAKTNTDFSAVSYTPHKNGYNFAGWNGAPGKITQNTTVSAGWSCRHAYDDGTSKLYDTESSGSKCTGYRITVKCSGCDYVTYKTGTGACVYEAWCGKTHSFNNPGTYACTRGAHRWEKYGCRTCQYCGKFLNGKEDSYGNYRSHPLGSQAGMWCVTHNGHLYYSGTTTRRPEKCNRNDARHNVIE